MISGFCKYIYEQYGHMIFTFSKWSLTNMKESKVIRGVEMGRNVRKL